MAAQSTPVRERPARKGTARTSRAASTSPVKERKLTKAEQTAGSAKLSKPAPKRAAAKPKAAAKAKTAPRATTADPKAPRAEVIEQIRALRAKGVKWNAIAAETGLTMSALARVRATGKRNGAWL